MEINETLARVMMLTLSKWSDADIAALNCAATFGTERIHTDTAWGKRAVDQSLAEPSGRITEELVAALSAEINRRLDAGTWGAA